MASGTLLYVNAIAGRSHALFQASKFVIVWTLKDLVSTLDRGILAMTTNSRLRSGNISAPDTDVSVYEAIHSRRMNNDFSE